LLVTLGAIGALLWLGHRGLRRDLIGDLQGLVLMVQDALRLRPIRRPRSRLAETQRAQVELMTQLRALGPTQGDRTDAAGAPGTEAGPTPEPGLEPLGSRAGGDWSEWAGLEDSEEPEGQEALDELDEIDEMEELELPDALDTQVTADDATAGPVRLPVAIFRAYDIRGLVERQLNAAAARAIGRALGSAALTAGDRTLMVGRDCRPSSPELAAALAAGIQGSGAEVVDLGVVPTPLVYFACCHPERHAGAVVTGSHNPPEYNGVKPVLGGRSATAEEIQGLRRRIETGDLATGSGGYRQMDPIPAYRAYIERDVALARPLRIVIDCGNATASVIAPDLYRALGCTVIERHCDLGAGLGGATADPSIPEYLRPLGELVVAEEADLGLAFDGDGDRLGVVDSAGHFIPGDRVLMLLAADVLSRNPGTDVIFDVKCSTHLAEEIRRAGGRPVMWRSGHAPLKARLRDGSALIAGELSGHLIFQERWFGFDDAVYGGARLLEVLSLDPRSSEEIFAALPSGVVTPELALPMEEGESARIIDAVIQKVGELEGAEVILIDGLRAEFAAGWGLVRASNTQPKLTFRFEGEDPAALESIQARFRQLMDLAAPGLKLPF
jgi:phosphomannomutase/phosphoglucomutase